MPALELPNIDKFSADEQAALNYHRQNLLTGSGLKHDDGGMTTFMGSVVDTDNGAMILPRYWGGSVREVPDAMRFAIRSGIKFPTYKSVPEALEAEKRMHDVMEQDLKAYMGGK
jgi:hypothetical protein